MTLHEKGLRPASTPAEQRFLSLYAEVAEHLPGAGHPAARASRDAALDRFAMLGLPHRRIEAWKYTDLRTLMPSVLPLAGLRAGTAQIDIAAAAGEKFYGLDAYRAVFADGAFQSGLSNIHAVAGLGFKSFRAAMDGEPDSTLPALSPPAPDDTIALLSAAFATDGAILTLEPNVRLDKPVHLIFVSSTAAPSFSSTRNAVIVGNGASLSIIETHIGLTPGQAVAFTHLTLGDGSTLDHVRCNFGDVAAHLSSITAVLGAGAHYGPAQITANGGVTRAEANIRFAGERGRCHYTGAMMLRGSSHADFTLVVDHAAANCESRELVKAVLDGRSRGIFQGKVIVQRGAQKTDGKQMANALLLSDDAEFDSKPELEIYADDVTCGHGATAGQLDDDLMFYLQARGIPEKDARALLIASFVGEALAQIENEPLREALQDKVDAWLAR